jgi:hypothetical protein
VYFENRFLKRIFGYTMEEVVGGWKRPHSEELHNLYNSPNIIRVVKARRMRCAGHMVHMGEMRNAYKILIVKPEGRRPLWPRIGPVVDTSECSCERSVSIKGGLLISVNWASQETCSVESLAHPLTH